MIKYVDSLAGITPDMLHGFFAGWPNPPSPETHLEILKRSDSFVLALVPEARIVAGFVNAITDGILCAYIPLLEVLPEYQGRGIGKRLMEMIIEKLQPLYMIDLICEKRLEGFYGNFNMKAASGMMLRDFKYQSGIRGNQ